MLYGKLPIILSLGPVRLLFEGSYAHKALNIADDEVCMLRIASACFFVATALCIAVPATGQHIDDRRGIWFALGLAATSTRIDCTFCSGERKLGPSGYVQIGGTPSRRTLAGVEVSYWRMSEPDTTREYAAATAFLLYYLSVERPLFLKGAFGIGRYAEVSGADQLSATGFSIQLGAGYNLRVTGQLWMAPFINFAWAPDQKGTRNKIGIISELNLNMFQGGISISWH